MSITQKQLMTASIGIPVEGLTLLEHYRPSDIIQITFYTDNQGTLVIGFGPTMDFKDWIIDFQIGKATTLIKNRWIKAHKGFLMEYLTENFKVHEYIKSGVYSNTIITGFSKGAAHGTLCHLDLRLTYPNLKIETQVFATPRVFSCRTTEEVKDQFLNTEIASFKRVNLSRDVVSRVPYKWWGYDHVGEEEIIGSPKKWFFPDFSVHSPEVYLNKVGS